MRCIWNAEEGVGAACVLCEIVQLYAASPIAWSRGELLVTDPASKGGHAPILFTMSDANIGERSFYEVG